MSQGKRVLVVDDNDDLRQMVCEMLQSLGYQAEWAVDGFEALAKLNLGVDLVIADLSMPTMDGFDLLRRIRCERNFQDLPVVMVTGLSSRENHLRAIEAGANGFISKPLNLSELDLILRSLLKVKETQDELKKYQATLEKMVEERTVALRRALEEVVEAKRKENFAHLETIRRLAIAAEYKDEDTGGHLHRISRYSVILAEGIGLPPGEIEVLASASTMHDVGKIGIPDHILLKPGKLEPDEWEIMKQHTLIGARILEGSSCELLTKGAQIAETHHERWSGHGYPHGLKGEEIPHMSRIVALADVFDALTSKRPYKNACPMEEARALILEGRGIQFDPRVVDMFAERIDAFVQVWQECQESIAGSSHRSRRNVGVELKQFQNEISLIVPRREERKDPYPFMDGNGRELLN